MTTLRRNLKNTVNNYSEIQCKVREATCNEPWGPSTTLMTEIADATYSVVEFADIMTILWKRLNDHGKNWRHVYKALLVLDFIMKRGSERVGQQCKEQIYSLLTLQDFRFVDKDGKDQGASVREKARQLVTLLKDEEMLKAERKKALQAKERFAQNSAGIGSANSKAPKSTGTLSGLIGRAAGEGSGSREGRTGSASSAGGAAGTGPVNPAIEQARPTDRDEEDLQLELALAISKEEAERDKEEDEEVLRATLERSKTETRIGASSGSSSSPPAPTLLSIARKPPPRPSSEPLDPWGMPVQPGSSTPQNDPWGSSPGPANPPLNGALSQPSNYAVINTSSSHVSHPVSRVTPPAPAPASRDLIDPWGGPEIAPVAPSANFTGGILQPMKTSQSGSVQASQPVPDPFDPFGGMATTPPSYAPQLPPHASSSPLAPSSKMGSILDNRTKHLVNLDNLIASPTLPTSDAAINPFGNPSRPAAGASVFSGDTTNPFLNSNTANLPPKSLNEMRNPDNNTNPFC